MTDTKINRVSIVKNNYRYVESIAIDNYIVAHLYIGSCRNEACVDIIVKALNTLPESLLEQIKYAAEDDDVVYNRVKPHGSSI
jgi:hypothetical protein